MKEEGIIVIPRGDADDVCRRLRRKYIESLKKGITHYKIYVLSEESISDWIPFVQCVLISNIAVSITVEEINEKRMKFLSEVKGIEVIDGEA